MKKAVVLLSGGLDSAVTLYIARSRGYDCHCLIFDYGQRHKKEIEAAKNIAWATSSKLELVRLEFPWKGSSLTDKNENVPAGRSVSTIKKSGIPSTYVPARNTVFLSAAVSYAEAIGAEAVFIGAHSEDSSGYPDCRKRYLEVFNKVIALGTKAGTEGRLRLEFPLIEKSKADIIKIGRALGVPFESTWSCYSGGENACGRCDSCVLRAMGFEKAGIADPALISEKKAPVTEIFSSIQGEGIFALAKQIFVRFARCNMGCGFCDTPSLPNAKEYTAEELLNSVTMLDKKSGPHHSVSLTGGEPLLYSRFLKDLLPALKKKRFKIYLETNGTLPGSLKEVIPYVDIIAMDFKLSSSTGDKNYWDEHLEFLKIASSKKVFVKAVVTPDTTDSDVKKAIALLKKVDANIPFVIQPATPVKASDKIITHNRLETFFELASRGKIRNAQLIPQIHKILGVK
jgi:7-cyano-7-deazaguanine synthase